MKPFDIGFLTYAVAKDLVNFRFKGDAIIKQENQVLDEFEPRFQIIHEPMGQKFKEILLMSTPHNAWIMEETYRLTAHTTIIAYI